MPRKSKPDDGVLCALERSRSVSLDEARAVCREYARELDARDAEHRAMERALDLAFEELRRQARSGTAFSVQQLHWNRQYIVSRRTLENTARTASEEARKLFQGAQDETARRLEELRVVEKLRARRREERLRVLSRRNHYRMDELGLIKAGRPSSLTITTDSAGEATCLESAE